jgi:hypothetical protein
MVNADRLKETEIFQDLTHEELDKIAVICTLEDFKNGFPPLFPTAFA